MNKRLAVWIIILLFLILFWFTRTYFLINLLISFIIFGLVIWQAVLAKKSPKNRLAGELVYVVGLGAMGGLVASLLRDSFTQPLNQVIITGYILSFIICIVLIAQGLLAKKDN